MPESAEGTLVRKEVVLPESASQEAAGESFVQESTRTLPFLGHNQPLVGESHDNPVDVALKELSSLSASERATAISRLTPEQQEEAIKAGLVPRAAGGAPNIWDKAKDAFLGKEETPEERHKREEQEREAKEAKDAKESRKQREKLAAEQRKITGREAAIRAAGEAEEAEKEQQDREDLKEARRESAKPGGIIEGVQYSVVEPTSAGTAMVPAAGEGGRGEPPEAPPTAEAAPEPEGEIQPPEGCRSFSKEELWSKEFRAERWRVAKEIKRIEGLTYQEIYGNSQTADDLDKLYKYWKYLEAQDTKKSYESKPFDPLDLEQPVLAQVRETYPIQDLASIPSAVAGEAPSAQGWHQRLQELLKTPVPADAQQRTTLEKDINTARDYLSRYFKEAHRIGILDAVDAELNSITKEIQQGLDQGLSPGEILAGKQESYARGTEGTTGVDKRIEVTKELGKAAFQRLRADNPNLENVWEIYINLAKDRLTEPFNPRLTPLTPIEGGFRTEAERDETLSQILEEEGETYWRPTYANYFTVYARTKEQYDIAKETFIRWARTGLGKAPNELFSKVQGFEEAITSAGQRGGSEMQEYTVGIRRELQAIVGIIDANLFNEQYKPDAFKQSWEFVAQHEGVLRMLRLIKTSRGVMAKIVHKYDTDPSLELLVSPHGSRGQLMGRQRNASEMDSLQEQILAILTAEVMGIALKKYHPDDPEKILDSGMYQRNLDEIVKFKSDEYFNNLYEGFDLAEQERLFLQLEENPVIKQIKLAIELDERVKRGEQLTDQEAEAHAIWKSGALTKAIERSEQDVKFARWVDAKIKKGETPALTERQQEVYDAWKAGTLPRPGIKLSELQAWERLDRARRIQQYLEKGGDPGGLKGADKVMYEEASNAVTLAYELYGAMGEKAQRGGTVFLVDRKDRHGKEIRDYLPDFWMQKNCLFAENWTRAEYSHMLADDLKYKVDQARRMAIWGTKAYGREAKLWDFTLLRDGKPIDPNTLGYTIYGENRNETKPIERYRYAVPVNERILGYNSKGEQVVLVFDDEGKPMNLEFDSGGISTGVVVEMEYDEKGKVVIWNKPAKTKQWSQEKQNWVDVDTKDRKRITFDNLDKETRAKPMYLKVPKGPIDLRTGKMLVERTELVHVDFDKIIHQFAAHPYSNSTKHPYWGYQEQDTGLVLSPNSFADARAIKEGRLRSQDASPHSVQLLMFDPTLERVGHEDIENLEALIVLAAVEQSYMSSWRIEDELYANFLPEDAQRSKNRTAYVLQDHGGSTKEWFHARGQFALWPDARTRRLRVFTPYAAVDFAAMSKMLGAPGGALDVFRMMGFDKYKLVGQFAFEKWINQTEAAQKVLESIVDSFDPQRYKLSEGLGRKLNNEADTNLKKYSQQIITGALREGTDEDSYQRYLVSARDSLNRMEVYENRNTVLQSLFRGERAPLWLEGVEVYQRWADGSYELDGKGYRILNPGLESNTDSGSSRHRNRLFTYRYARFVRSPAAQALYPDTARHYAHLDNDLVDYPRLAEEALGTGRTPKHINGWDWLDSKANN